MAPMPKVDWPTAIAWLIADERDDFFPDVIRFRDVEASGQKYFEINERKIFQYSREHYERLSVPKSLLLKRQTLQLPLSFRIIYEGLFLNLFYEVAPYLDAGAHSYRKYPGLDHENREYPFPSHATKSAWLKFKHGFNVALHAGDGNWGIISDITTFYERINVEKLIGVLKDLIPPDRQNAVSPSIDLLHQSLLWCSDQGWGVPQNYDPSSFFCSAFLTPIDRAMSRIDGITYSRWVDDIRIVAPTRGKAIQALHRLQDELARLGLGVNAKKTILLEPGSVEFVKQISVDNDEKLNRLAEEIATCHETSIRAVIPDLVSAIKEAKNSDERFLRAYGGQLLKAAEFVKLREECLCAIRGYALDGFHSNPEKADWWCKFLSPDVNKEVQDHICAFFRDENFNIHEWANQWALITLSRAANPTNEARTVIRDLAMSSSCIPIKAHAISAMGHWEDNIERRKLADLNLVGNSPSSLRRAAVIAIQELPEKIREDYYKHAMSVDPELAILIDYIRGLKSPRYHAYSFPNRNCVSKPVELNAEPQEGFGLVGGQWTRFKVRASYFPDYD